MIQSASQKTPHKKMKWGSVSRDPKLLLLLLPFIVLTFLFAYMPLFGWSIAFMDYKPAIPIFQNKFVGFDNFVYMLKDKRELTRVMTNTVMFAGLGYLVSWLPILLAILLNEVRFNGYKRFVQTVTTFPNFISWVIVYALAFQMFSYEGMVSTVLQQIGLIDGPISPIANKHIVYGFQTAIGQWKGLGWSSIIYMSALAGVDQELYEAAAVDGANRYRRIWHISLPCMLPTYVVLMLLGISSFVGVGFEQYWVFRNPVVSGSIDVIDVYVYNIGLGAMDYAYGTAIGVLKSAISLLLVFGTNVLAKRIRGNTII